MIESLHDAATQRNDGQRTGQKFKVLLVLQHQQDECVEAASEEAEETDDGRSGQEQLVFTSVNLKGRIC